jgi:hypothetical protein
MFFRENGNGHVDTVKVTKVEAASRQLDAAIRLLFNGGDVVAVHTLAGAASIVISDLLNRSDPERSWDKAAQEVMGLTRGQYLAIVRRTQNFLKHADRDADAVQEFPISDTECTIFWAVMNMGELPRLLTMEQSVFQLWFLASNSDVLELSSPLHRIAVGLFGNLAKRSRPDRLAVGLAHLRTPTAAS